MAEILNYSVADGVATLSLAPGSAGRPAMLDGAARAALRRELERAAADKDAAAVVITGQERGFPAGLPVHEIGDGTAMTELAALCRQVETLEKPVVAAMRGVVMDGGFELALAADARLATRGTSVGHRDIRCGLLPGAGATQRLPRLIGARAALDLLLGGQAVGVTAAQLNGLCHAIVDRNVVGAANALARRMLDAPEQAETGGLPTGMGDPIAFQQAIEEHRRKAETPEAVSMVKAVEAAQLLPLEVGLEMETVLRDELLNSDRAKGLLRSWVVEADAVQTGAGTEVPGCLTLLGEGPFAQILARRALQAGLELRLAEQREGGAAGLTERLKSQLDTEVSKGLITSDDRDGQLARLSGGAADAMLQDAEFVIEAGTSRIEMMEAVAATLRGLTDESVPVLLSSNMALRAGDLAGIMGQNCCGLALTRRPGGPVICAEIAVSEDTDTEMVARAHGLLTRLGLPVVDCAARNGLIAQALMAGLMAAAEWCVAHGAAPNEVDQALQWPLGPFQRADLEGMAAQSTRFEALGWAETHGGLYRSLDAAGHGGQAVGRGVYDYATGTAGEYTVDVHAIVNDWQGEVGQGAPSLGEIRRRIWSALFFAGLQLLQNGTARDGADIDLVALEALSLPRASGGPMKTAELRGLLSVRRELEGWGREDPAIWNRSELLNEMIKNGWRFG
ncbi:enoyl-CoA hydratase-related protein [Alisedimentitalea sp. MJ-SS2]|uniref:enoyl-CoA hydratase-related protein n=1 Tax=Aliisedimentitalea sp. MJ-SS2 TaxID=3049795 RepID=UPI002905FE3A|nr:enoyl-CoA hydratase-related protein [Alisedimentitalea sp. MJ-SS2]MDU8929107.1 enoyl-CoA hydratase-related protein [Alisedimentitalea sp. MJ-SS2]